MGTKLINGELRIDKRMKPERARTLRYRADIQASLDKLSAEIEQRNAEIAAKEATAKQIESEIADLSARRNRVAAIEMRFQLLREQFKSLIPENETPTSSILNHLYNLAETSQKSFLEYRIDDLQGALRIAYRQIEDMEPRLDHAERLLRTCRSAVPDDLALEIDSFFSSSSSPSTSPEGDDSFSILIRNDFPCPSPERSLDQDGDTSNADQPKPACKPDPFPPLCA